MLRRSLQEAERISEGKACVYVTGSFGRYEASQYSDLDLFIVGKPTQMNDGLERSLSRLDEICIKADLIEVTRQFGIPQFSGDGEYLEHYTILELVKALGTRQDDVNNTFTARLLLLLESRPLLGNKVYLEAIDSVLAAYWKDYQDHKKDFVPAFLANDILRLWRTFCVNYEARTSSEPERKKAKRKLKNFKLKHSRLLTCYSALLYLLSIYAQRGTVDPTDAFQMVQLTPTERLERLFEQEQPLETRKTITHLLEQYERFLQITEEEEETLVEQFLDKQISQKHMTEAYEFGDSVFDVLTSIGKNNRFHRLLVV